MTQWQILELFEGSWSMDFLAVIAHQQRSNINPLRFKSKYHGAVAGRPG